jgi:hypothetical protein
LAIPLLKKTSATSSCPTHSLICHWILCATWYPAPAFPHLSYGFLPPTPHSGDVKSPSYSQLWHQNSTPICSNVTSFLQIFLTLNHPLLPKNMHQVWTPHSHSTRLIPEDATSCPAVQPTVNLSYLYEPYRVTLKLIFL